MIHAVVRMTAGGREASTTTMPAPGASIDHPSAGICPGLGNRSTDTPASNTSTPASQSPGLRRERSFSTTATSTTPRNRAASGVARNATIVSTQAGA